MVGFFGSKKKAVPPITSENGVFHEGDIYGWPTTPGKGLTREIEYSQPLALLSSKALMQLLESQKIGTDDCLNHGELLQRALQHNLAPPVLKGPEAVQAKAREMVVVMSRLDRKITFSPNSSLGLTLQQANEWAVVTATPPKWESQVRVGDALQAVNGESVLLLKYDDMFERIVAAKGSGLEYSLTFRRAPFHRGWLFKRGRGKDMKRR